VTCVTRPSGAETVGITRSCMAAYNVCMALLFYNYLSCSRQISCCLIHLIKIISLAFFFHFVLYEIMLKDISLATTKFLNFKAFSRFVVLDIEFRISNINIWSSRLEIQYLNTEDTEFRILNPKFWILAFVQIN
jgi:hypothetical protein